VTETAFDKVIGKIREAGFHNHRQQDHSDDLSMWILDDLLKSCDALLQDWESHEIFRWLNVRAPGTARGRKMDLMIGPPAKGFNGAYPWRTSHSSWLGSRGELTRPESDERPCPLPGSAGAR
jgi:hypothetical protein